MRETEVPTGATKHVAMPVHFFLEPTGISLERALALDPDRDWTDLLRAKEVWILQTWIRLRRGGYPVTFSNTAPSTGLIVYHKEEQHLLLERLSRDGHPILVAVRGDFRSADAADFEIVQNGYYADGERLFFVPHWPQPGLIPRDPARGSRVENIAFKGFVGNLIGEFHSAAFRGFLTEHQLSFAEDAAIYDEENPMHVTWNDYHDVDVVMALRPGRNTHKPASKLCNAWLAGVPAILSPDYAFRELRRGPLDYLEASTVEEAQQAVLRLKRDPDLYQRMVENGLKRSRDFTVEQVTALWAKLLFETVPRLAARHPLARYGASRRRLRTVYRKARTALLLKARW